MDTNDTTTKYLLHLVEKNAPQWLDEITSATPECLRQMAASAEDRTLVTELYHEAYRREKPVMDALRGQKVRILKGTAVLRDMHPQAPAQSVVGRTMTITVHDAHAGYYDEFQDSFRPPSIVWPGSGGYWREVDARVIEFV